MDCLFLWDDAPYLAEQADTVAKVLREVAQANAEVAARPKIAFVKPQ